MLKWNCVTAVFAVLALLPEPAQAQKVSNRSLDPIVVDPAAIKTPELQFTETDTDKGTYDKYFYFARDNTDFATAYQDIRECDALARGMNFYGGGTQVPYPYMGTMAGVVGGLIGSLVSDAIAGSAQRRQMRRTNLRTCMGYKGYGRYGLRKELWAKFNFEEGNRTVPEAERQKYLQMQAKAAIAGHPSSQELEF